MNKSISLLSLLMLASSFSLRGGDLVVSVQIDGESKLVIKRDQVYWDHLAFGRPGTFGVNEPTMLNCFGWFPIWPSTPNGTPGPSAPLLDASIEFSSNGITLEQQAGRAPVTILQQPSAENDFTLIVYFFDSDPGADHYMVTLHGVSFSMPPPDGPNLSVSVQIDGHSYLVVRTNEVFWNHVFGGRPGTFGVNEPSVLNSYQWFPTWPDTPNGTPGESSRLAVRARFQTNGPITLRQQAGRTCVTIYQQPLPENGDTLVVDFDDSAPGGADHYAVTLNGVTFSLSLKLRIYVSSVNIVWATETNKTYQLQSAVSPFATEWRDAGQPVAGTGTDFTFTDPVPENTRRFYRVIAIPQP